MVSSFQAALALLPPAAGPGGLVLTHMLGQPSEGLKIYSAGGLKVQVGHPRTSAHVVLLVFGLRSLTV